MKIQKDPNVIASKKDLEDRKKLLEENTRMLVQAGYLPGEVDPMAVNQLILNQIVDLESQKSALRQK